MMNEMRVFIFSKKKQKKRVFHAIFGPLFADWSTRYHVTDGLPIRIDSRVYMAAECSAQCFRLFIISLGT